MRATLLWESTKAQLKVQNGSIFVRINLAMVHERAWDDKKHIKWAISKETKQKNIYNTLESLCGSQIHVRFLFHFYT